jgi:hypothetical protein
MNHSKMGFGKSDLNKKPIYPICLLIFSYFFMYFLNNQFQSKGQWVKLIKKVDNELVDQKEFKIDGDKLFDGWFKLG